MNYMFTSYASVILVYYSCTSCPSPPLFLWMIQWFSKSASQILWMSLSQIKKIF